MNRFFRFGVIFLTLFLVLLTNCSGVEDEEPFVMITPTVIPPDVLTRIASSNAPFTPLSPTQTQVRPAFDLQQMYPVLPEMPMPEQILATKLEGTLSGFGILRSIEPPVILHGDEAGAYELSSLAWEEWTYDSFIIVLSGYMSASPTQGILWVQITPHHRLYQDRLVIPSPVQAGKLTITSAGGERLILNSEQGQIFYFDVPVLRFVGTLEETIPAATSMPETPLTAAEDAPNIPIDTFTFQQFSSKHANIPLDSFINSSEDYDWFYFRSNTSGTITVSLIPRSGNYGLRVVLVDRNQLGAILQEDTTLGNGRKQVVISDAPSGDYLVRVWSLDGSFSESLPYTLRFDAPEPEKVIPVLECVAENSDGTYTADFGYENPNPFVVVVDAKNYQNKFEPPPNFRTGQPEGFAPGRVEDWFSVLFDGNGLTWVLDGHAVTANRNSPRCP
jgi:hypothetical protein